MDDKHREMLKDFIRVVDKQKDGRTLFVEHNSTYTVSELPFKCEKCKQELLWKDLNRRKEPLFGVIMNCPICKHKQILKGIKANMT